MNLFCSKCGAEVAENAKFCPSCGGEMGRGTVGGNKIEGDLEARILDLLRKNEFISAVKLVRENTGMGLKEAADYTRGLAAKNGIVLASSPGSWIVLFIVSSIILAAAGLAVYFAVAG